MADLSKRDVDAPPAALMHRDVITRDLMRFFRERGTPVEEAVRYGAFFVGFAIASFASARDKTDADVEVQRLLQSARDAVHEGMGAVRAALESEIGRALHAHRYI